ncbi:hypothetical protein HD554DRAFT_2022557, partial [Boletus coccyginus]
PHADAPIFIVAWIMNTCDSITLDGKVKPRSEERSTYSHAQKMRAAMTYAFGRLHGLGDMPWHRSEVTNQMLGNPSVSTQVSSYMCALRQWCLHSSSFPQNTSEWRWVVPSLLTVVFTCSNKPDWAEIKPFFLYTLHESEAHLCAVRALARWIAASRIRSGYLFRRVTSGDRVTVANAPMVCTL